MRLIKVDHKKYEAAVRSHADKGEYVRIPSSKSGVVFAGIMMPAGIWVPWPMNLTEEEMKLYLEMYGDIPDLVVLKNNKITFRPESAEDDER